MMPESSVDKLIRIADGRRKRGLVWPSLREQLQAITALGATGSKKALDFLRRLAIPTIKGYEDSYCDSNEIYPITDYYVRVSFKNAHGALKRAMRYKKKIASYTYDEPAGWPPEITDEDALKLGEEAHETVFRAIRSLEQDLAQSRK